MVIFAGCEWIGIYKQSARIFYMTCFYRTFLLDESERKKEMDYFVNLIDNNFAFVGKIQVE